MPEVCPIKKKRTMDWNEIMMQYAPEDCKPTVVGTAEEEALKTTAESLHKKVEDLTGAEKAKAEELAEQYRRATDDPMDAYRD